MSSTRPIPLGVLAITAIVPAVLLGGIWQYAESNSIPTTTTTTTTPPGPPADPLTTPLLSFRRQPEPLAERVADAASAAAYADRLDTLTGRIGPSSCLWMQDVDDVVVADVNGASPVIPASNEKLLVAAVALDVLGPGFRYRTELRSLPPVDGVVPGDVSLIGGGDPVLWSADVPDPQRYPAFNTTSLDELAEQLVRLGITRIDGDVVGDGSRYDDEFRAPSWGDEITSADAGPYDALLVNDGIIENGNRGRVPARSAAAVFTDLVRSLGIEVTGGAANDDRVTDPSFTTLALVESHPLEDVLVEMLHTSDNNTAEMVLKELGYQARGEGTRIAGLDVVQNRLAEWGMPLAGASLQDGSGLSRDNRVSCELLAAVLGDSPVAAELVALLPVAGRDGTLAEQLLGTDAEGRLRAKTGTLTDVKALSGRQPDGAGDPLTFSLVLNGGGVDEPATYLPVWNDLVALIGEYPIRVEPDVDRFAPR